MTLDELISVLQDIRADHGGDMEACLDDGRNMNKFAEDVHFDGAVAVMELDRASDLCPECARSWGPNYRGPCPARGLSCNRFKTPREPGSTPASVGQAAAPRNAARR